jgi:hypothetical protein
MAKKGNWHIRNVPQETRIAIRAYSIKSQKTVAEVLTEMAKKL